MVLVIHRVHTRQWKLVMFDTLNSFLYRYNTIDMLGKDVNHYHKIRFKTNLEQMNLFYKYNNKTDHWGSFFKDYYFLML